jgi:hypothetical protein
MRAQTPSETLVNIYQTTLHGAITQKTTIFILTTTETSNPTIPGQISHSRSTQALAWAMCTVQPKHCLQCLTVSILMLLGLTIKQYVKSDYVQNTQAITTNQYWMWSPSRYLSCGFTHAFQHNCHGWKQYWISFSWSNLKIITLLQVSFIHSISQSINILFWELQKAMWGKNHVRMVDTAILVPTSLPKLTL